MQPDFQDIVVNAFRQLMRPVIRILIKNGMVYRQFAELCKELYVEIAAAEYGLRGRPTNVSRVALLTGLDRKHIKRIQDARSSEDHGSSPQKSTDRISRLLSGWHQDPEFSVDGVPRDLPLIAPLGPCFAGLVQRYGGDVPGTAILKELLRSGAVEELSGSGHVRALKRYYMPAQTDAAALQRAGAVLADIGNTVVHNLYRPERQPSRFEGRTTNTSVAPAAVNEFRGFVEERGQEFLEAVDQWLTVHEVNDADEKNGVRLGLGLYWIEDPATTRRGKS